MQLFFTESKSFHGLTNTIGKGTHEISFGFIAVSLLSTFAVVFLEMCHLLYIAPRNYLLGIKQLSKVGKTWPERHF